MFRIATISPGMHTGVCLDLAFRCDGSLRCILLRRGLIDALIHDLLLGLFEAARRRPGLGHAGHEGLGTFCAQHGPARVSRREEKSLRMGRPVRLWKLSRSLSVSARALRILSLGTYAPFSTSIKATFCALI